MSKYATVNPATGEVVQRFDTMSDDAADRALTRAHQAYLNWREVDLKERAAVIGRVADLFRGHAADLARLMTLEMGKPVTQAKGEVELSAAIFEYYATKGPDLLADETLDIAGSGTALVRTAPIGALLGIMPWNFPYYQAARFVAPNLLLGNTILLKHAANCPQQAMRLAELLEAAGAPADVYQNIFATTEQVANMIASPLLQGVSLTGSERAGNAVGEPAGKHLKKAVLELGGSDPFIVLPGADIDKAVLAAVTGRFGNAGQVCTSSKRMIVESSIFDEFLDGLVSKAESGGPAIRRSRRPGWVRWPRWRPAPILSLRSTTPSPKAPRFTSAARFPRARCLLPGYGAHRRHSGYARLPRGAFRTRSRSVPSEFGR